jgi:hypothetical protein
MYIFFKNKKSYKMYNFTNTSSDNDIVTVKIINDLSSTHAKTARLNLTDNLLKVRQVLEVSGIVDNTLLFSRKYLKNDNDNKTYGFAEIALEKEENYRLNEIIDKNGNILYLKQCSTPDWNYLNNYCKLDYGCTMTFNGIKKAYKRVFVMKDCELTRIGAEGYREGFIEFKSNNDRIMKNNLFFSTDINVKSLEKLGISIGNMENEGVNSENISSYHFTEYGKVSLKFGDYLEPTQEFIKEVVDAIESENFVEILKQMTEQYGQFIPTEVILGGRAYFNEHIKSTNAKVPGTKLIGGTQFENFDEVTWAESLKNYKSWDLIELRKPTSIFQLLPYDLRIRIIESVGKRIHHSDFVDFNYYLEEFGKPKIFKFKDFIPSDILNIIQNKEADCNIFATVVDMKESKDDFFTCQVLCPPDENPSLIIHCIQKKFKRYQCKLKIGWMVIGYYTDFSFILSDFKVQLEILKTEFSMPNNSNMSNAKLLTVKNSFSNIPPCLGCPVLTKLDSSNDSLVIGYHFFNAQEENKIGLYTFSYCLKNNHHVNLPKFTFYTLIISNAYNIVSFDYSLLNKPYIDFNNTNPKFISLYSTKRINYGPIFLKQNSKKIKPKIINCKNRNCPICKNETIIISKDSIKCVFFGPYIRFFYDFMILICYYFYF